MSGHGHHADTATGRARGADRRGAAPPTKTPDAWLEQWLLQPCWRPGRLRISCLADTRKLAASPRREPAREGAHSTDLPLLADRRSCSRRTAFNGARSTRSTSTGEGLDLSRSPAADVSPTVSPDGDSVGFPERPGWTRSGLRGRREWARPQANLAKAVPRRRRRAWPPARSSGRRTATAVAMAASTGGGMTLYIRRPRASLEGGRP